MAPKSIKGSPVLAKIIKARRLELGLTIEEAAFKAGVGTKTWSRYESGESIRADKYKGVCKASEWKKLPDIEKDYEKDYSNILDFDQYRTHEAWSKYIEDSFGEAAAATFVVGSDILLDEIQEDMNELARMPKGTHIGQLNNSWLESLLPPQFLMEYDYNFLYLLRYNVERLRKIAHHGGQIIAHSVLDELTLYLIVEESRSLFEDEYGLDDYIFDWVFDLFEDMDIITFLYSDLFYLSDEHAYHFNQWNINQFFT